MAILLGLAKHQVSYVFIPPVTVGTYYLRCDAQVRER